MNWLSPDDGRSRLIRTGGDMQCLLFPADMPRLRASLPTGIEPEKDDTDPLHRRLFAEHSGRVFNIEYNEVVAHPDGPVYVFTHFLDDRQQEDWNILRHLPPPQAGLALDRPRFVESRNKTPRFTVYIEDPRGWNCSVYHAASREEANGLERYLRLLSRGFDSYVIGDYEEPGHWQVEIITDTSRTVIAGYTQKESSLSYAYARSTQDRTLTLCVWNTRGQGQDPWYLVRNQKIEGNHSLHP